MSSWKLIYFTARGRAEVVRLIFVQLGISYEDVRIPFETWPEFKPASPYGTLPYLEYSGRTISGSTNIARYVAERFGLAAATALDNAELYSIVEACNDTWDTIYAADFYEKDETLKAEKHKVYREQVLPDMLARLERRATTNNAQEGWIWGTKLTYADFMVYHLYEQALRVGISVDGYPTLQRLRESVESLPKVAQWLKERPDTFL